MNQRRPLPLDVRTYSVLRPNPRPGVEPTRSVATRVFPPSALRNAPVTACPPTQAWNDRTPGPSRTTTWVERLRKTECDDDGLTIWDAHGCRPARPAIRRGAAAATHDIDMPDTMAAVTNSV